jgi:hypothetical protein
VASASFSQRTVTGIITSAKGKTFILKIDSSSVIPVKRDSCSVSKDISGSNNPFGINISSGWMGVAKGVVSATDKNTITVLIIKETSNIVVNGKKTEHFIPGKRIKLDFN